MLSSFFPFLFGVAGSLGITPVTWKIFLSKTNCNGTITKTRKQFQYLQCGHQLPGDIGNALRIGDRQDVDGHCLACTEGSLMGHFFNGNFEELQCCNIYLAGAHFRE